jgi:hypothetical protein
LLAGHQSPGGLLVWWDERWDGVGRDDSDTLDDPLRDRLHTVEHLVVIDRNGYLSGIDASSFCVNA